MAKLSSVLHKLIHEEKEYLLKPPFPEEVSLEIFTGCNHQCLFCPNKNQTHIAPMMPLEKAVRLLKEAFALGARKVGLYAKGEPFAVRNIAEYIAAAHAIGFQDIYLTTNGSLLSEQLLRSSLESGLTSLKFSINGFHREQYYLMHGKDDFDIVVSHLNMAVQMKKSLPFSLFISIVKNDFNRDSRDEFIRKYSALVDEIITYECSNFCGYMDNMFLHHSPPARRVPCNLPFAKAHISPEGYMTACCGDYENFLAIADLNTVGLKAAWESDLFVQLRQKHIQDQLAGTICQTCIHGGSGTPSPLNASLANKVSAEYWKSKSTLEQLEDRRKQFAALIKPKQG